MNMQIAEPLLESLISKLKEIDNLGRLGLLKSEVVEQFQLQVTTQYLEGTDFKNSIISPQELQELRQRNFPPESESLVIKLKAIDELSKKGLLKSEVVTKLQLRVGTDRYLKPDVITIPPQLLRKLEKEPEKESLQDLYQQLDQMRKQFSEQFPQDLDGSLDILSNTFKILDRMLLLSPDDPHLQNMRGDTFKDKARVMEKLKRKDEFEEALNNAVKIFELIKEKNPNDAKAWKELGSVELLRQNYKKALGYISRALEITPGFEEALKDKKIAEEAIKQTQLSPKIFISYSRTDEYWKNRLLTHLGVLQQEGLLDLWDDSRISAGEDWYQKIQEAIKAASVAVLLVSADFLTSKFILGKEVPDLLERRDKEGLRIFPVIIKPCAWNQVKWLSRMNLRPKGGRPILAENKDQTEYQTEHDMAAIAEEIAAIIKTASSGQ